MNKKLKRKQALIMAESYRTPFNSKVAKVNGDVIEDSVGEIKYATSFNGATKIEDANKNLLVLPDTEETTQAGVTYSIKDGVITLNGTTTDIFNLKLENVVKVEENQTYYLYQKTENTTSTLSLVSNVSNYSEEPTFFQYNNKSKKMTKTGYLTLHLYITNTTTFTNAKFYVMLVLGTTAPTEFEPNFKNLLEIGDLSERTKEGLTYYYKNGMIVVNGTSNGGYTHIYDNLLGAEDFEDGATYSFNDISNNNNLYLQFSLAKKDGTTQYLTKKNSFVWDSNIYSICYISVQTAPTITTFNNIVIKPTLVKSSIIPSQFIPFANPYFVSLGQNGSVQYNGLEPREIDLKGNVISKINNQASDKLSNYALTKNTKVVDLGSLTWETKTTDTAGVFRMVTSDIKQDVVLPINTSTNANILCTKYKTISGDSLWRRKKGIAIGTPSGEVSIYDPEYNTSDKLEAFKKAIRGTLLMYQVKNPTTINTTSFKTFKEDANATISDDNFTSSPNAITETFKPTRSYDFKVNGFSNVVKSSNLLLFSDKEENLGGIEFKIKDGIVTINGTSDSNQTLYVKLKLKIGSGTYSFNSFASDGTRCDIYLLSPQTQVYTSNNLNLQSIDGFDTISFFVVANTNYNNLIIKPMLVSGSMIPTHFIPYLAYIESFADKRNFIEINDVESTTTNGVTYSIKNGVIKLNGTPTTGEFILVLFSVEVDDTSFVGTYLVKNFGTLKDSYLNVWYGFYDARPFQWEATQVRRIQIQIPHGETVNGTLMPMLVSGITPPTTFLPYQDKYSAFLNVKGKNLLEFDDVENAITFNGMTYSIKNGVITVNGTPDAIGRGVELYFKPININIGDTYSIALFNQFTSPVGFFVKDKSNSGEANQYLGINENIATTWTVNACSQYEAIVFYLEPNKTYTNLVIKPILVSGSTAPTEYEPYYSFTKEVLIKQPLRKFDYLTYDGVYRQTNEIVLDGTNNIYVDESSGIIQVLNIPNVDSLNTDWGINYASQLMVTTSNLPLIQSYLIQVEKQKGIGTNNGRIFIKLDDSVDNSLNNWTVEKVNNYFKQNPITITYKTVDQTFEATSLTRLLFKNGYNKITAFDSINNNAIVEYLEYYKSKGD